MTLVEVQEILTSLVDEELAMQLEKLTLPAGMMRGTFRQCRKGLGRNESRCFIARIDGVIVGWAIRFTCFPRRWIVHIYVDPAWRRARIGTTLIKAAGRRLRRNPMMAHPWDDTSQDFYESLSAALVRIPPRRKDDAA